MLNSITLKKTVAIVSVIVIVLFQFVMLNAQEVKARDTDLEIRVQYAMERGDMIRLKTKIPSKTLNEMSQEYCYSNIKSIGNILVMRARGVPITDILRISGIDINSVDCVYPDTDDNYGKDKNGQIHIKYTRNDIVGKGYYYPYLNREDPVDEEDGDLGNNEDNDGSGETGDYDNITYKRYYEKQGNNIIPLEGFDKDMREVPAILATEFGESSGRGEIAEEQELRTTKTYRFCIGQTKLTLGKPTTSADVTSKESAHSIYGLTFVLKGYPIKGLKLSADTKNIKIGSKKTIKASFEGDESFKDIMNAGNLIWESSNTAIATVDKNGVVTFKKKGKVTITARVKDENIKSSITFGAKGQGFVKDDGDDANESGDNKDSKKVSSGSLSKGNSSGSGGSLINKLSESKDSAGIMAKDTVKVKTIKAREITLGDKVMPESNVSSMHVASNIPASNSSVSNISTQDDNRNEMASDAEALEENKQYSAGAGAAAGGLVATSCVAGIVLRIRRFRMEV